MSKGLKPAFSMAILAAKVPKSEALSLESLGQDVALLDAGAGGDPLVRGLHDLLDVRVGNDVVGMVDPDAADDRAHQATWVSLAAIFSATWLWASR